jgi:hypothetical protein
MVSGAPNGLRASAEGRGACNALEWGEAVGRARNQRGGRGGVQRPLKWQAVSGSARGEGKKLGARAAARGVREWGGGGELWHDPGSTGVGCSR